MHMAGVTVEPSDNPCQTYRQETRSHDDLFGGPPHAGGIAGSSSEGMDLLGLRGIVRRQAPD